MPSTLGFCFSEIVFTVREFSWLPMSRLRFVSSQHFKVGISLALAFIMLSVCLSAILLWEICLLFFLGCFKIFSYFLVVCIFMSLWLELCFFLFIQLDKCYPFCICEFISFTNSGNLGHFLFKRFHSFPSFFPFLFLFSTSLANLDSFCNMDLEVNYRWESWFCRVIHFSSTMFLLIIPLSAKIKYNVLQII